MDLTFPLSFGGRKILYLAARDVAQNNSGWQAAGSWEAPGVRQTALFPISVFPWRGSGLTQTFTFTFNDNRGFADLGVVNILINDFLDGRRSCYLAYNRVENTLYLVNDDDTALLPGLVLNGSGSVGNSQCTVSGKGSSVDASFNFLHLTLSVTFAPSFAGNRVIYMAARDNADIFTSGWEAMGTWLVE